MLFKKKRNARAARVKEDYEIGKKKERTVNRISYIRRN